MINMYGYGTGYVNGYTGVSPYHQVTQNRLNQQVEQYGGMYQPSYNNMQNNNVQMMQQQQLKGRPVSGYDEAKASMIDLDGSLFIFPDIANKKIYTKQILLDGSAEIKSYVLEPAKEQNIIPEQMNSDGYVLRKDFDDIIGQLKTQIDGLKGGSINDSASNANV